MLKFLGVIFLLKYFVFSISVLKFHLVWAYALFCSNTLSPRKSLNLPVEDKDSESGSPKLLTVAAW